MNFPIPWLVKCNNLLFSYRSDMNYYFRSSTCRCLIVCEEISLWFTSQLMSKALIWGIFLFHFENTPFINEASDRKVSCFIDIAFNLHKTWKATNADTLCSSADWPITPNLVYEFSRISLISTCRSRTPSSAGKRKKDVNSPAIREIHKVKGTDGSERVTISCATETEWSWLQMITFLGKTEEELASIGGKNPTKP